uniref:Predicted protein n=1 Tax=Physcomitrium patens TaxID=3218 RepID=A9U6F4_PHYPA
MWSRLRGSILFQAVLFSVPSQRTLFLVNGSLKGKNGGKSLTARANFGSKLEVEKLTLEPNKVALFLQAADGELQEKLEPLLEDKEEDEGLTTKWKNVEDAVGLLTKKERRKDRSNIPKPVQALKAPLRTTPPTMPTVQPSTSLSKKADMGMEEIIRGMRDLQIKLARLEENTSINNSKNVSKQGYVQRYIWCDDASHTRKDCNEFNNMIRQGIICWKDGKIALKDREDLLQTNFGKGGMRALVQDYLKEHETVVRESSFIFQQSKTDRLLDYWRISILPCTTRRLARSRAGKHYFFNRDLNQHEEPKKMKKKKKKKVYTIGMTNNEEVEDDDDDEEYQPLSEKKQGSKEKKVEEHQGGSSSNDRTYPNRERKQRGEWWEDHIFPQVS